MAKRSTYRSAPRTGRTVIDWRCVSSGSRPWREGNPVRHQHLTMLWGKPAVALISLLSITNDRQRAKWNPAEGFDNDQSHWEEYEVGTQLRTGVLSPLQNRNEKLSTEVRLNSADAVGRLHLPEMRMRDGQVGQRNCGNR